MDNLKIYEAVRSVPVEAQKPFRTGRFEGTDINPMWRIKMLTEQFGPCGCGWYFEVTREWEKEAGSEVCIFVDIKLYIRDPLTDEWSMPIHGTGGNKLVSMTKNGAVYVNDEAVKMATTDAISVACKHLGIGADIYWGNDNTKYNDRKKDAITEEQEQMEKKPITKSHVEIIKAKCADFQIEPEKVYTRYRKDSLESMTEADYARALTSFKKMES